MADKPVSILFVCTGNTCRSPMAEALARRLLDGDAAQVRSAGTAVTEYSAATDAVDVLLAHYDIDLSGHRPTSVDDLPLGQYDVIIAMGAENAATLRQNYPDLAGRIRTWEVADPYHRGPAVYRETAAAIERETRLLAEELGLPLAN